MTDDVVGGLDEPDRLQPEQGALALASPEDDWSRADWEEAAAGVLRRSGRLSGDDADGAVWAALTRSTYDGVSVPPLGTPDLLVGLSTAGRPTRVGDWDVRTLNRGDNAAALQDLENGATSLWLDADDVDSALEGVLLDLAPVVLEGGTPERARALLALAGAVELPGATNLGADPIGARVRGRASGHDEETAVEVARMAHDRRVRGIVVDATCVHDLGASDAQEIGYSLAAGAAYLRLLTESGLSVDDAARLMEFRYAATDEELPTIAKLRAARRCWARVLELCGTSGEQRQHAVTSRPMLSAYDPWVNMLRGTVAAFAAGVGGADAVTVLPFDSPLGEPDAFGRRIARNTSALLIEESHVATVTDPAGGAYAVEKLTDDLAVAAWELFGRLDEGADLDALVAETVAARDREVATRQRPLTGLSEFPDLAETVLVRPPAREADVRRYGVAFEALRDDPVAEPVLLAPLGTVAQHTARATFATNLLAAGGITVESDASGSPRVACVVGTDAAYAEEGAERAAALREAGVTWVIVAGKPLEWADDACAMGVDAIDFLTRTRERLA